MKSYNAADNAEASAGGPAMSAMSAMPDTRAGRGAVYRNYVLLVISIGQIFSNIDRQLTSILLTPIKTEFHLSDTQLGFLSGIAFAFCYAICGLPLGRVADRWSRRHLMTIALVLWSIITTLGGFVRSYAELLLVRFGVGVGEAGYTPAALSMIADYFPPARRQLAVGLQNVGATVGIMLGLVIGGLVAPVYGWRAAFIVSGFPGLLVGILFWLTVEEPERGASEPLPPIAQPAPPLPESLRLLRANKSYVYIGISAVLQAFSMVALATWMPSFFQRSHHLPLSVIGPLLGLAVILGGAGSAGGGLVGDRLARKDAGWPLYMTAISMVVAIPSMLLTLFLPSPHAAMACYALFYFLISFNYGPQIALFTVTVPVRLRALAMSIGMFVGAVISYGLGPLVTGALSDALAPAFGAEALRAAMALVSFTLLIPALTSCIAARHLKRDLGRRILKLD
jgi:MFS family permease